MDFTELFKQSGGLCRWSPDGRHVAVPYNNRLAIRDIDTLQIVQYFTCRDTIQDLQWSPDSKYILCALYKRGSTEVWSLDRPDDWSCKIDEGPAGLARSRWSPDSRHIVAISENQIRATIWSLTNRSVSYVKQPKFSNAGLAFSSDGRYMALLQRKDCKDLLNIFSCESWELLKQCTIDTVDAADLAWSPDDTSIAVWDSLLECKVLIYSLDGRLLRSFSPYENQLGVKTVKWSPSSQFLAVGCYDQNVRILNHVTWNMVATLNHPTTIRGPMGVTLYREVSSETEDQRSKFIIEDVPLSLNSIKPDPEKPNPKIGVGVIEWSPDGRFFATKNDNTPHTIWIWEVATVSLCSVVSQLNPVKSFAWDPCSSRLAICSGSSSVYLWSEEGCSCIEVPAMNFAVNSLVWSPQGTCLALLDKDRFCCCYPKI